MICQQQETEVQTLFGFFAYQQVAYAVRMTNNGQVSLCPHLVSIAVLPISLNYILMIDRTYITVVFETF